MSVAADLALIVGAFVVGVLAILAFGWLLSKTSWFARAEACACPPRPLRWWVLVATGLLSGILGCGIAFLRQGTVSANASGLAVVAGPMVGIPVFGLLGGALFRRVGVELVGQLYGLLFGGIGFGSSLARVLVRLITG